MSAQPQKLHAERFAPAVIGRLAVRALYAEIALYPKPGLVSPQDSGSHNDMDYSTFLRSLFSLRFYFPAIARAGQEGCGFSHLQHLGLAAEARMLAATGGINSHRGAIFSLGLIAAAAGALAAGSGAREICRFVGDTWGAAILNSAPAAAVSHGLVAVRRHGARGAREEAAAGFPLLIDVALPHFCRRLGEGHDEKASMVETLFLLMSRLDDTNLLHRGGRAGLDFARGVAGRFLDRGGIASEDWFKEAETIHRAFVERRLSPGGAADMLAAMLFLHALTDGRP